MVMEDHVLLAAMKLSHGEDLITTITGLHEGIKALEDVLTHNLEAFNWFNLSIPTDVLICQPSQSLPAAEINYFSLFSKLRLALKTQLGSHPHPTHPRAFPLHPPFCSRPPFTPNF
jgi:hypothetical protein